MVNETDRPFKEISSMCILAQKDGLGKIQVGAVCHGIKKMKDGTTLHRYFSGANLHVSDSFGDVHAEQLAVNLSLLDRYYPTEIFVTSKKNDESVKLCGSCRHYLSEINYYMTVIILNPNGLMKSMDLLSHLYPFAKDTVKKNMKFKELCKEIQS